jgi:hypothetical protein
LGITRDSSKVLVESGAACRVLTLGLSDLVVVVSITSTKYGEGHSPNANTLAGAANVIGPLSPRRLKSTPYSVYRNVQSYPLFPTTNLDEIMKHYI